MVAFIVRSECPLIILVRIPSLDLFLPFLLLLSCLPSFFPLPTVTCWPPPLHQPLGWDQGYWPYLTLELVEETGRWCQESMTGRGTDWCYGPLKKRWKHSKSCGEIIHSLEMLEVRVKRGISKRMTFYVSTANPGLKTRQENMPWKGFLQSTVWNLSKKRWEQSYFLFPSESRVGRDKGIQLMNAAFLSLH